MKKILAIVSAMFIIGSTVSTYAVDATPTDSTVFVDGTEVKVNAYNIDGYNYFKLRDIAYMLNGTEKQFNVVYNGALDSIVLTSNQSYTPVGGEMAAGDSETKETFATSSKIIKDGVEIEMTAYNIDGNNYFKLRELGEKFDFGVNYDEMTNSVKLSTDNTNTQRVVVDENGREIISGEDGYGTNLFTPSTSVIPTPGPKHYVPAPPWPVDED